MKKWKGKPWNGSCTKCMKQWKEKPWNGIVPNVYEAMERENHGMEFVPNVMFMHKT